MVSKRAFSELLISGILLFIISTGNVNGHPYGPHPPDAESGFSLQKFRDYILGGFPSDKHTHDPSEKYMHKGQEPSAAEVAVAGPHGQKLAIPQEANGGGNGVDQLTGQARVMGNRDQEMQGERHQMEDEPLEELDVPHKHPEMHFENLVEEVQQAATKDIVILKEEI